MSDFIVWEPGETVICVLCGKERGGADPPGPWTRNYSTGRRRVPILRFQIGMPPATVGYMEYFHL